MDPEVAAREQTYRFETPTMYPSQRLEDWELKFVPANTTVAEMDQKCREKGVPDGSLYICGGKTMMSKQRKLSDYQSFRIQVLPKDSPVRPPQPTTLSDIPIPKNISRPSSGIPRAESSIKEEQIQTVLDFMTTDDRDMAYSALRATNGDTQEAINLLMDHPGDIPIVPAPPKQSPTPIPTRPPPEPTPTNPSADPHPTREPSVTRPASYSPVSDKFIDEMSQKLGNNPKLIKKVIDEMRKHDREMADKVLANWDLIRHRLKIDVEKSQLDEGSS